MNLSDTLNMSDHDSEEPTDETQGSQICDEPIAPPTPKRPKPNPRDNNQGNGATPKDIRGKGTNPRGNVKDKGAGPSQPVAPPLPT